MPKEAEPVQLQRDPFGRRTLMRRTVYGMYNGARTALTCANCGTRRYRMFQYGWESDSVKPTSAHFKAPHFCSVDCFRDYCSED